MPFQTKLQQRWMYANRKRLARQGVDVDEWSRSTDYSKLPERKGEKTAVAVQQTQLIPGAPPVQRIVPVGPMGPAASKLPKTGMPGPTAPPKSAPLAPPALGTKTAGASDVLLALMCRSFGG